jgi:hypothetical protein
VGSGGHADECVRTSRIIEDEEDFSVAVNPEEDALASGALPQDNQKPLFTNFVNWLRTSIIPSSAMAWALTLMAVVCVAGYWSYRLAHPPRDAKQVLNQSIKLETAALQGQTEHQVLQLEKISATGSVLQRGTFDVLKDGHGNRYIRRLYDSHYRLVVAEWRLKSATHSTHAHDEPAFFSGVLWDEDISVREKLAGREPELRTTSDGYESTVAGAYAGTAAVGIGDAGTQSPIALSWWITNHKMDDYPPILNIRWFWGEKLTGRTKSRRQQFFPIWRRRTQSYVIGRKSKNFAIEAARNSTPSRL